jgi:type IV pilus assembly protein PilY1
MKSQKPTSNHWHSHSAFALTSLLTLASPTALSDDIEVYLQEPADTVPPNILFVLDQSGSMAENNPSRRDVLVSALKEVFNNDDMGNINTALMGYSSRGYPALSGAFKVISEGDNKSEFIKQIDKIGASGTTPTVYALKYAVEWFKPGVSFRYNGINYASPLEEEGVEVEDMQCAPNHIILLSDGAPNSNYETKYNGVECDTNTIFESNNLSKQPGDICTYEIAAWANETDLMEDAGWDGIQNITLSTMGFYTSGDTRTFLQRLATTGGGTYYDSDGGTLVQDLTEIITNAQANIDYAYTAPVIPFSAANSAISGDEIYVPMFAPEDSIFWKGNLKKYSIEVSDDGELVLRALNNNLVLNDEQEFESTRDLFCDDDACSLDEGDPLVGGVAQDMTETRNLYTYLGSESELTNGANRVRNSNKAITANMLGVATEETRTELLNWITRDPDYVATDDDPSHSGVMGAPIHTQPIIVDYDDDDVVMIPTSEGVLMAIDADLGEELWSFMPQDLLPGIRTIKNNDDSSIPYYGLDGPMTYYEVDDEKMVIFGMRRGGRKYHILNITDRLAPKYVAEISSAASEDFSKLAQTWSKPLFANMLIDGEEEEVLVFGGGYHPDEDEDTSSDDTDSTSSDDTDNGMNFSISNISYFSGRNNDDRDNDDRDNDDRDNDDRDSDDSDSDDSDSDDSDRDDSDSDDSTDYTDGEGNVIYIVKASDGSLLKSISDSDADVDISEMTSSIASDLATVDLNGDTRVERLYASDVDGRIIRIDIDEDNDTISGGVIADINDGASSHRMFFTSPQIGYYNKAGTQFLTILIGTGDITNPLDSDVTDRFYMIKDPAIWYIPDWDSYEAADDDDFLDASDTTVYALTAGTRGWYIDYSGSEKSFSKAILYDYSIFFTTYSAESVASDDPCEAVGAVGTARLYGLDLLTANAVFDWDGSSDGTLSLDDRSKVLELQGIPPSPALVFPATEDEDGNTLIGKTVYLYADLIKQAEWSERFRPIYWEEVISE